MEPDPIYGSHFASAFSRYFEEIGNDAAGMIEVGIEPGKALSMAQNRVQLRRAADAKAKAAIPPEALETGAVEYIR